jgi:general stress protein 26
MDDAIQKLGQLIRGIRVAMLATVEPDGKVRSRPMLTQETEFDGTLWFFTSASSHKMAEVEGHHEVNLSYADPSKERYVSVSGRAEVVRDRSKVKELWRPLLKAWFPEGPEDPDVVLLKVQAEQAEYWDAPSSRMVQLAGLIKALVKGEEAKVGQNEQLDLTVH